MTLCDGGFGEFFVPPGQRPAVQVHEALRVRRKRSHLGLQVAPVVDLYRRATDIKPMRRKAIADDDTALPHCFEEAISFHRRAARRERDLRIGHDLRIAVAGARHRAFRERGGRAVEDALRRRRGEPLQRLRHPGAGDDLWGRDQSFGREPRIFPVFDAAQKSDEVTARFERLAWQVRLPGVA